MIAWPAYTDQLDYELEIGFFVGRGGGRLSAKLPRPISLGVTVFNDVSARDIQLFEIVLTIGPSKGKDFHSVMGPVVLAMDRQVGNQVGRRLTTRVDGEVWSHGTTTNRQSASPGVGVGVVYGETFYPGEFLAIGTVGGGCSGRRSTSRVQPGDVGVELEATEIGIKRDPIDQEAAGSGERRPAQLPRGAPWFATPHALTQTLDARNSEGFNDSGMALRSIHSVDAGSLPNGETTVLFNGTATPRSSRSPAGPAPPGDRIVECHRRGTRPTSITPRTPSEAFAPRPRPPPAPSVPRGGNGQARTRGFRSTLMPPSRRCRAPTALSAASEKQHAGVRRTGFHRLHRRHLQGR